MNSMGAHYNPISVSIPVNSGRFTLKNNSGNVKNDSESTSDKKRDFNFPRKCNLSLRNLGQKNWDYLKKSSSEKKSFSEKNFRKKVQFPRLAKLTTRTPSSVQGRRMLGCRPAHCCTLLANAVLVLIVPVGGVCPEVNLQHSHAMKGVPP